MDEFNTIENADLIRLDYVKTYGIPPGWKNKRPRAWLRRIVIFMLASGILMTILSGCARSSDAHLIWHPLQNPTIQADGAEG